LSYPKRGRERRDFKLETEEKILIAKVKAEEEAKK